MTKTRLIIFTALLSGFVLLISPIVYDVIRSAVQRRALQNRNDFPQIAADCAMLMRATTSDSVLDPISDPRVPARLRALSPSYISASSNHVTLEFHGGFDHYGYRFRETDTDPKQWALFYYTEQDERLLTTISQD